MKRFFFVLPALFLLAAPAKAKELSSATKTATTSKKFNFDVVLLDSVSRESETPKEYDAVLANSISIESRSDYS